MSHKTPFDRSTSYWGTMRTSLIRAVVRLLIGGGLLAGCGYAGPQIDFNPRPADAPDFVVFGVSGHCLGGCPSSYNPEYLLSEGTLDVVMDALDGNGWTAQCQGYGDSLYTIVNEDDEILVRGFLEMVRVMGTVRREWIEGFDNPTKVIVVAHSHGTVWAHSALFLEDQLPVEILVDLDGESLGWESDSWSLDTIGDDWTAEIDEYAAEWNPDWWFDVANPADSWNIPGLSSLQDIEDVVPDSVLLNIEAASHTLVVQDGEPNHRLDGTTEGIFRNQFDQGHGSIDNPGGAAMNFVADVVSEFYDPS